uniref:Telomere length regulation protein TEL2 homolog n=1 Tax=Panagrellus redivivus TaxID=6233 RepID=A0A7E4W294_PANRE
MSPPESSKPLPDPDLWTCMCQILTGAVDTDEFSSAVSTFTKYIKTVIPKYFLEKTYSQQGSLLISVIRSGFERAYRINGDREDVDSIVVVLKDSILDSFRMALKSWPKDLSCNDILSEYLFAIINSSDEVQLPKIIATIVDFESPPAVWLSFLQRSRKDIRPFTNFFTNVLTYSTGRKALVKVFSREILDNTNLFVFLTNTALTRRIQPINSSQRWSFLVAEYLAEVKSDAIGPVFKKLVNVFVEHSKKTKSIEFAHQIQVAVAVLDFGRRLPEDFHPTAKKIIGKDIIFAIDPFLKTTDNKRRQLGLAVCEALIRLYPPVDGKLPIGFDYDRSDPFVVQLLGIISSDDGGECPAVLMEMVKEKQTRRKKKPEEACILDSDDSEDEGQVYMNELKDAVRSRAVDFDTTKIQALLVDLKNEEITVYFSALTQLIVALENGYITGADIGAVFVKRVINLPIRTEIPNCNVYHYRLIELILSIRPDLCPSMITCAVSKDCDMEQRTAIFRGLVGAANLLATGRGFDHLGHISDPDAIEDEKPITTHTIEGHPRSGTLTRVNPSFLKIARHKHKNTLLHKAPLFLFPLVTQHFPYLDDFKEDPMKRVIISQLIYTASFVITSAYLSPNYIAMCRAVAEHLKSVRFIEDPLIQESIVFAYGAVIRGLPPMTLVTHFATDIEEWVEHVGSLAGVMTSDPESPLAATLRVTVPVVSEALMSCAQSIKDSGNQDE